MTLVLVAGSLALSRSVGGAVGTWIPLANSPSGQPGHMLLLSDGNVMVQNNGGTSWFLLTPDSTGGYTNGNWSNYTTMNYPREYYSSVVLQDGRVFVAGGEYPKNGTPGGTGGTNAEIFDPVTAHWTVAPNAGQGFYDSASAILPDGRVLVAPVGYLTVGDTLIYNPVANSWSNGASSAQYQDEASWVKLPDDSILTIDPYNDNNGLNSERYIPSLKIWINDAHVPVSLYNGSNSEIGAGLLLPDGRAFFLGGTGHTAIYTPSGDTNNGAWARGPEIPNGMVTQDAPAAMMVNGKILCVVTSRANHNPMYFYEYDPVANSFNTNVLSPTGGFTDGNVISDASSMLDLPDGTVLFNDTSQQLYVYKPDPPPLPAGKPTVDSVSWNRNGSLHLTGKLFNGISQGAMFGDDCQQDSNYPLVRLTDGGGNVYYGRTYNWSSTSVRTGNKIVTTEATLPATVFYGFPGIYSLQVVANGIASDPVTFYGPVWVDFNYMGVFQFGIYGAPYNTLAEGVSMVASGGTIAVKPGLSHETMTISKPMMIISVGGPATIGQ